MRIPKPLALLSALVLVTAPAAAQQAVTAETTPAVPAPTTPAAAPAPKPSPLYESNTPAPGTIKEAQEASAQDTSKKHTLVITTLGLIVAAVILILIL